MTAVKSLVEPLCLYDITDFIRAGKGNSGVNVSGEI